MSNITKYKVWFCVGHPRNGGAEFAIEFRANTQQKYGPYNDVWDAAKILSDRLHVYMTGEINKLE